MSERPLPPPDENFWKSLSGADRRVLFLDYDGTLAPFRVQRDQAVPYPGVRELLAGIVASGACRTVIISGRWTKDLPDLLGLDRLPEIWGSHGMERLFPDGRYEMTRLEDRQVKGLAEGDDAVARAGLESAGEHKPGCLALHWRGLDGARRAALERLVEEQLRPLAMESDLVVREFDGGYELRAPARDKGDAVRTVLAEEPGAVCAYLGDDLTDEDAFRALGEGGLGVLVREKWRPTEAKAWLRPPEELLDFLSRWAANCRGQDPGG